MTRQRFLAGMVILTWCMCAVIACSARKGATRAATNGIAAAADGMEIAGGSPTGSTTGVARDFRLVTESGHPLAPFTFSSDGSLIAGGDGRVWHVDTGKLIAQFPAGRGTLTDQEFSGPVAISQDMKYIALQLFTGSVIYDLRTGAVVRTFPWLLASMVQYIANSFSPDGKYFACVQAFQGAYVYDLATGRQVFKQPQTPDYVLLDAAFSPDGTRYVVAESSGSDSEQVQVFSVPGFTKLKTLQIGRPPAKLAFTRSGLLLTSRTKDVIFPVETRLWNLETGESKNLAPSDLPVGKGFVASISRDGKVLALLGAGPGGPELTAIELASGKRLIEKIPLKVPEPSSTSWYKRDGTFNAPQEGTQLEFSPDGAVLAVRTIEGIELFDVATGRARRTITGRLQEVYDLAYSGHGNRLAVSGGRSGEAFVWDLTTLRLEQTIAAGEHPAPGAARWQPIYRLKLDQNGDRLALLRDKLVMVYEVRTARKLCEIAVPGRGDLRFLGKDELLIDGDLHDAATCTQRKRLTLTRGKQRVVLSPDESTFAAADFSGVSFVNAKTGAEERWVPMPPPQWARGNIIAPTESSYPLFVEWGPDNKTVYLETWSQSSMTWIARDGAVGGLQDYVPGQGFSPVRAKVTAASAGSSLFAWGGDNGDVAIVDRGSGKLRKVWQAHPSEITGLAFSPSHPNLLATASDDVRIWNLTTNQSVTLVAAGREWVAYNDEGLFDASKDGGKLVAMVRDQLPYGVDQFAVHNNRPDALLASLGLGDPEAIAHFKRAHEKRLRKAGVGGDALTGAVPIPRATVTARATGRSAALALACSDPGGSLRSYSVFVNDVPVASKPVSGASANASETIVLSAGDNKIEASCANAAGVESVRALIELSGPPATRKPTLWVLGFGVSQYADPKLKLEYAAKDASDLGAAFTKMKDAFAEVNVQTLVDAEVTPAAIEQARAFAERADVDDLFVLFIAGHGVHDEAAEPTYYYLTHGADLANLAQTAAPFELIEGLLQATKARQKLFLMDTCESGELDPSEAGAALAIKAAPGVKARAVRGIRVKSGGAASPPPRPFLLARDRFVFNDLARRSGAIIFSSSRGGEFSYETEAARNGVFTQQLKAALSGEADLNRDGIVSVDELRAFVATAVPRLTGDKQHPTVDRDNLFVKFGFPVTPQKP